RADKTIFVWRMLLRRFFATTQVVLVRMFMAAFEELEEFFVQLRSIRKAFDPIRRDPNQPESEIREAFAYFQRLGQSSVVGLAGVTDPQVFDYAFNTLL